MKKEIKTIITIVISRIIDIISLLIIVAFLGMLIYNFVVEEIYVHKKSLEKDLVQEDKDIIISEYIAEKIYNAYIEEDSNKVNSMYYIFNNKSAAKIKEISNSIKIDADKVDAKALEIYKIGKKGYRFKVQFKPEEELSYEMNGKNTLVTVKIDPKTKTFKILDMKVGV